MKKLLCVLLSLIIVLSLPVSVIAYCAQDTCGCGFAPVVYVRGFGAPLYLNPDSDNPQKVFGPSKDSVTSSVPAIIKAVNSLLVTKDYQKFGTFAIEILNSLLGDLDCDDNGNSVLNVGAICPLPTVDTHMIHNYGFGVVDSEGLGEFSFEYDWRADPMEVADDLNEYIDAVRTLTRHDKVIIYSHSQGNNITSSYLAKYGSDKVEKLIFVSGAFQGLGLVGHLFTKDINIENKSDELENFIATFLGGDAEGDLLTAFISILNDAGVIDKLLPVLDGVLDSQLERLYNEYIIDVFCCMPGIWSFVPDEYYEDAKDAMFGDDAKYETLITKIDDYHYNVQAKLSALLTGIKEQGIPVSVVSNYGISPIPVYDDCYEQCDMLIDTKYTSIGATCAKIGTTLKSDPAHAKHMSPDNLVDASTCLLPDSTWFFKYQGHSEFCAAYRSFVNWLIKYEGQPTVFTSEQYPQFMICVNDHSQLVPVGEENTKHYNNDFIAIIMSMFKLILQLFKR